jgi:HSP20 family molecular chaperone IbpA|tara:strand:- start:173 stop:595 length:423 start_codon:yes stop_codon:yes gene_type:complete
MSNLFNYLTTNPRAGSVSPVVDLFNTAFGDNFATPASFSNDNIRFNESEDGARIEIDLPGVKKENLKVTYSEESNNVYVEAKRTITTKTGSKEETYTRSFHPSNEMNCTELDATISEGVLSITIPRKARKEAKVIDVKVA